jgi:hypothetical protein
VDLAEWEEQGGLNRAQGLVRSVSVGTRVIDIFRFLLTAFCVLYLNEEYLARQV